MTIFQGIILAIIEGLTEFLPVSSTGHMIIGSSVMGIQSDEFVKLFTVAIQLGAILSVIALYFKPLSFISRSVLRTNTLVQFSSYTNNTRKFELFDNQISISLYST